MAEEDFIASAPDLSIGPTLAPSREGTTKQPTPDEPTGRSTEPEPATAPNFTPDEARAFLLSLVADGTLTQARADAIAADGDRDGIRSLVSQGILDPSDLQAVFAALQELQ